MAEVDIPVLIMGMMTSVSYGLIFVLTDLFKLIGIFWMHRKLGSLLMWYSKNTLTLSPQNRTAIAPHSFMK
jgi:hypothetical protein